MTQFVLEHPIASAIIVIFALIVIDNAIANWARVRIAKHSNKEDEN